MLEWEFYNNYPMLVAKSPAAPGSQFRILHIDGAYWDSFSKISPTQNLEDIKRKAQEIHDSYK